MLDDRFWSNVLKTEGCWIWMGARSEFGYGWFYTYPGERRAHRIVFTEQHGHIPDGMFVCHTCDNPPCVNPDHLFLGTPGDNVRDAVSKGRHRWRFTAPYDPTGERNPSAKLRESDAIRIIDLHAAGSPIRAIARELGIPRTTVQDIARAKKWRHLPRPA